MSGPPTVGTTRTARERGTARGPLLADPHAVAGVLQRVGAANCVSRGSPTGIQRSLDA